MLQAYHWWVVISFPGFWGEPGNEVGWVSGYSLIPRLLIVWKALWPIRGQHLMMSCTLPFLPAHLHTHTHTQSASWRGKANSPGVREVWGYTRGSGNRRLVNLFHSPFAYKAAHFLPCLPYYSNNLQCTHNPTHSPCTSSCTTHPALTHSTAFHNPPMHS